jgi:hypothetical protein
VESSDLVRASGAEVTDLGEMDLVFSPAGDLNGYEEWSANAVGTELIPGLVIRVASLDGVIASKRLANRATDLRSLPYLELLKDEIRGVRGSARGA